MQRCGGRKGGKRQGGLDTFLSPLRSRKTFSLTRIHTLTLSPLPCNSNSNNACTLYSEVLFRTVQQRCFIKHTELTNFSSKVLHTSFIYPFSLWSRYRPMRVSFFYLTKAVCRTPKTTSMHFAPPSQITFDCPDNLYRPNTEG